MLSFPVGSTPAGYGSRVGASCASATLGGCSRRTSKRWVPLCLQSSHVQRRPEKTETFCFVQWSPTLAASSCSLTGFFVDGDFRTLSRMVSVIDYLHPGPSKHFQGCRQAELFCNTAYALQSRVLETLAAGEEKLFLRSVTQFGTPLPRGRSFQARQRYLALPRKATTSSVARNRTERPLRSSRMADNHHRVKTLWEKQRSERNSTSTWRRSILPLLDGLGALEPCQS